MKLGLPTLRGEHRLREFENRVTRKIFGPQRDEVTAECGRLFKEELYDLYCSLNITGGDQIKEMSEACSIYKGEDSYI